MSAGSVRRHPTLAVLLLAALLSAPTVSAQGEKPPDWNQIEQLASQQKLEEAAKGAEARLAAARNGPDDAEWARALIKVTQLRIGLHGYETAVRFLAEQPWPREPVAHAAVDLFYANSLLAYIRAYSWELRRRERVESKGPVDLKAWTLDQIVAEAQRAFVDIWKNREVLGREPLSRWDDYLELNNYPPGIRSTLRDAISYLWVEQLADTSLWRPEQENDLFRLDLKALIQGNPAASAGVKLDDPEVHPLVKLGAVLDDLEAWHRAQGHREAALEARLERARRLNASFTRPEDKALVRQDLEARLPGFADVPWWSMGMATLADLWRDAGDRVQAHTLAEAGARAFPESVGGKRCLFLARSIEAPDYQLSGMATDGLKRRSILVTHRNLKALYLRAWRLDLDALIAGWKDYNLLPQGNAVEGLIRNQRPAAGWTVALPATPDFQEHQTFVTPPLEQKGLYIIAASADEHWSFQNNRIQSIALFITDLVLTVRQSDTGAEARVLRGDSGQPVAGADVELYRFDWGKGHRKVGVLKTDVQGLAKVDLSAQPSNGGFFLIARAGDQRAIDPQQLGFFQRERPQELSAALVYTDRSVYRPLQKVLWKVVAYRGRAEPARYRVLPDASVTVSLIDANGQEVEKKTVRTNGFGSASGDFNLPAGRLLGGWRITTEPTGQANIRVEEYKRPTFEATFKDPEAPLRLNKPAVLVGEARYYFGLPVTTGQVKWQVTREPLFPLWWGPWRPPSRAQVIAAGATSLGEGGTFRVSFTPGADERTADAKDVSYSYRVTADVTDEGGETRSAERVFRLGLVSVEGRIESEAGFFLADRGGAVTVVRTDLDGTPRPGKGSFRLVALKAPDRTLLPAEEPVAPRPEVGEKKSGPRVVTEGDRLRSRASPDYDPEAVLRTWPEGEQLAAGALVHDAKGEARVELPPLPAGAYRLEYETVDDFGAKFTTARELLVGGKQTPVALPLVLRLDARSVRAGETARLLVVSGLPEQPILLEIHRARGTERRVLIAGKDPSLIELPIRAEDRGGVDVRATSLRDYQLMTFTEHLFVPYDDKELKLEFATFRDRIRPGEKETFRVTVKGPGGVRLEAGAAELLAYMYDRSLDIFAPHAPPAIANLYPQRSLAGYLRSTVGPAPSQWIFQGGFPPLPEQPSLQGDRLKFQENYGVGGPGRRRLFRMGAVAVQSREAMPEEAPVAAFEAPPPPPPPPPPGQGNTEKVEGEAPPQAAQAPRLRSDFSETAFWLPRLLTDEKGSAVIEFTVPDSVTAWNVWVHAVTRELAGGSVNRQTRSVKDLMVRPYLPRFLREGDQAELQVVLNNASDRELQGNATFELMDPETKASLLDAFGVSAGDRQPRPFKVTAGGSTHLTYAIKAPARVGPVAIKVVARAGDVSDGELRALPVLPSRVHLAQSRFVTLHGKDERTMRFEELARQEDPTRINEQLVVTVDAQLFYSVLEALPYLVNYPYECTEQTLNRFVSTGIVSRLYRDYPGVARMAQQLSRRQTPLETWEAADPNRKMALEETPWLQEARGGQTPEGGLVNVLDARAAAAERQASLEKLKKAQTELGAFPWWPGGPPSPYMTLYIVHGLARAAEYGVEVPKDMTQRAWGYLARHYRDEYAGRLAEGKADWQFLTFLNYAASSFPDASYTGEALTPDERKRMLDYSFAHWKEHSPYLKGYLALTLKRMGRPEDALRVWDSVMDSAKTTPDQGTFWAPEDRSWLWYNDTVETQAFALRTLMELRPDDPRRDGLVQWLLLDKKLAHWKSTRATAEAIYALVKYLEKEKELAIREEVKVSVGTKAVDFVFEPDRYTGKKNQVVLTGPEVDARAATVRVEKPTKGLAFASATWMFSTEKLPAEERGDFFSVSRRYFKRQKTGREAVLTPLAEGATLAPGDEVEVQLSLRAKHAAEYVHLRDPRAAGMEPEDVVSRYRWDQGIGYYEETRDSGGNFFFEWLPAGEYTFRYRLRANLGGTFRVGPATVQSMYAPEFNAYSAGDTLRISGSP